MSTTADITKSTIHDTGVYISAPLGGGHVTAKNGVRAQQEEASKSLGHKFSTAADIDITKYVNIGALRFGDWMADTWNNAQKKGQLGLLRFIANPIGMRIAEFLLGWLVKHRFKNMLRSLAQEPKFVVSTQAFCAKELAEAVYEVNKEKAWKMHFDIYLTDLPSKRATHFFPSVKRISHHQKLRNITTLHAPDPIGKITDEEKATFWKKHCGLVHRKTDDPFPIRQTFLHTETWGQSLKNETFDLPIKVNNPDEALTFKKTTPAGLLQTETTQTGTKSTFRISLNQKDKVGFLMLGSQPTTESVLAWLQTFVRARQQQSSDGHQHYFFLYCGAPETNTIKNPLLAAVTAKITEMAESLPKDIHIIPFTNQDAEVIAPLMARSDLTITRSGGATSMELLQLHNSKDIPKREDKCTFIHSEALTRPNDMRILEALRSNLITRFGTREGVSDVTPREWKSIKKEIATAAANMGIPRYQAKGLAGTIIEAEWKKGHPLTTMISSFIELLNNYATTLSLEGSAREEKILRKMHELKSNTKYKDFSPATLRKTAIETLLVEEGIILWEAKNARHLQKTMGANVVNPEYAEPFLVEKFFKP